MRPNTKSFATSVALIALLSAGPIMAQDTTDPMTDDPAVTTPADETMPETMPADETMPETMPAETMPADDGMATDDGIIDDTMTDDTMTDDGVMTDEGVVDDTMDMGADDMATDGAVVADDMMTDPMVTPPEGYVLADLTTFTADQLLGTDIYGTGVDGEEHIGSITDFVLSADNAVAEIITDVGGFLGIGQRSVSIPADDFTLFSDTDGNLRGHVTMTREQIEALPEFVPPVQ